MNKNLVFFTITAICSIQIIYICYLINFYPIEYKNKYYIYIVILLLIAIFYIFCIKLEKNIKINIISIIISTIVGFYFVNLYLFLINSDDNIWIPKDKRTKFEVIKELRDKSIDAYTNITPRIFLDTNGLKYKNSRILPLGGISNKTIITANENNYWAQYISDEHGFNNSKNLYKINKINICMIGDSFTEGEAVHVKYQIHTNLKKKGYNVINFGRSGSGPISEYAIFKEYAMQLKPEFVLWFFHAGSDYNDVYQEMNVPLLNDYIYNDLFSQELLKKQHIIDKILLKYIIDQEKQYTKPKKVNRNYSNDLLTFIGLNYIWNEIHKIIYLKPATKINVDKKILNLIETILNKVNNYTTGWGGKLVLIYIPDLYNLRMSYSTKHPYKNKLFEILEKGNIDIIDLEPHLFADINDMDIVSKHGGHFNEQGYVNIADIIKKYISNL